MYHWKPNKKLSQHNNHSYPWRWQILDTHKDGNNTLKNFDIFRPEKGLPITSLKNMSQKPKKTHQVLSHTSPTTQQKTGEVPPLGNSHHS
jgi:hypothetical protein